MRRQLVLPTMAVSGDTTTHYEVTPAAPPSRGKGFLAYFKTKRFWLVLFIGFVNIFLDVV